jgi:hypothetical protein
MRGLLLSTNLEPVMMLLSPLPELLTPRLKEHENKESLLLDSMVRASLLRRWRQQYLSSVARINIARLFYFFVLVRSRHSPIKFQFRALNGPNDLIYVRVSEIAFVLQVFVHQGRNGKVKLSGILRFDATQDGVPTFFLNVRHNGICVIRCFVRRYVPIPAVEHR